MVIKIHSGYEKMERKQDDHGRRSIRLTNYDYSQEGAYFVTVCIQNRDCLLGEITGAEMGLLDAGWMVMRVWNDMTGRFPGVEAGEFVVMPNHVYGIVTVGAPLVGDQNHRAGTRPAPTLGDIVGAFKSITTTEYIAGVHQHGWRPFHRRLWQSNYYEHVIRNEHELTLIMEYVNTNHLKWALDRENPERTGVSHQEKALFH